MPLVVNGMNEPSVYVIAGAGQAGCVAAMEIRNLDPEGAIILIGAESHPPYERPALSKDILSGSAETQSAFIKSAEELGELGIDFLPGLRVTEVDPAEKTIQLDNGSRQRFEKLLLATGSHPRQLSLSGSNLKQIHTLRSLDDCLSLRKSLSGCSNLMVIGAGFIGLEVAATAVTQFGCNVTVLEMGEDILQRGAPRELRSLIKSLHTQNNVKFRLGQGINSFEGDGSVEYVVTSGGEKIPTDCVVVGIGVEAEIALAESAGLRIDNGILVNQYGETSCPDIFAAGEVTCHGNEFLDAAVRLESWQIAQLQSLAAARAMTGQKQAFDEIPWFWTDQFGHNFQLIGRTDQDLETVQRQYDGPLKSTIFYLDCGRVVGALCVNSGKDVRLTRDAIRRGIDATPDELANPSVKLKRLIG